MTEAGRDFLAILRAFFNYAAECDGCTETQQACFIDDGHKTAFVIQIFEIKMSNLNIINFIQTSKFPYKCYVICNTMCEESF